MPAVGFGCRRNAKLHIFHTPPRGHKINGSGRILHTAPSIILQLYKYYTDIDRHKLILSVAENLIASYYAIKEFGDSDDLQINVKKTQLIIFKKQENPFQTTFNLGWITVLLSL